MNTTFSQTDFTEDLKKITVPTLVMHGMPTTEAATINADLLAFIKG
jgi:non-heme chloroperoxidase